MLDDMSIERVDKFGEELRGRLQAILRHWLQEMGIEGDLLEKLSLKKAGKSDYWSAKVRGFDASGNPKAIDKNILQLNGQTYHHPSYTSPKPWKLLARFSSPPSSLLWQKKPPYIHNRQPYQEWSPGGLDLWGVSYESFAEALSKQSENDIIDEILEDLHVSFIYANGQQPPRDSANINSVQSAGRVDITLSLDEEICSKFRETVAQQYKPRRKHPKRPSHAKLLDDAIDSALMLYINQWKDLGQDEDQSSGK